MAMLPVFVQGLKCYTCAGTQYLPSAIYNEMNDQNITDGYRNIAGACKQSTYCANGTYCAKRTVTYTLGVSKLSYKYSSYVKLCTSIRLDSSNGAGTMTSGTCYNSSISGESKSYGGGFSRTVSYCYCNNKDYCNSAATTMISTTLLAVIAFLYAYENKNF
uniref:UPAR/Ly6 domain-containing protein n=1 Tax=Acrobeloides nanus TaxID=290746 RepID=A0A914DW96_9BILA